MTPASLQPETLNPKGLSSLAATRATLNKSFKCTFVPFQLAGREFGSLPLEASDRGQ